MMPPLRTIRDKLRSAYAALAAHAGPHRWPAATPRLWILMYHRVLPRAQAVAEGEEPGMFVTPKTFARHLGWLRDDFEIVRLAEWVQRAGAGLPLPRRACAITFDDGWLDNHRHALPLLRAAQAPATVFAVSHMIGTATLFWPNRVSRLLERHADFVASDPSCAWLRALGATLPGGLEAAVRDADLRSALIHACKALPDERITALLDTSEQALGAHARGERALMNWEELREMVATGLVDVGSHTCHHLRLRADLAPDTLRREILESRAQLERQLARPITLFCYPNGDYTPEAAALVQQEYAAAVTTTRGINRRTDPLNTLRRIGMHEDVSDTRTRFLARLSGWR